MDERGDRFERGVGEEWRGRGERRGVEEFGRERFKPFEVNFGYTLLIYYLPTQHYSWDFVKLGGYLYDIKAQGYKEVNGVGFGYYRNIDNLRRDAKIYGFSQNEIISYKFNSKTGKLTKSVSPSLLW